MYRDIVENYDNFNDGLKSNYPGIVADVISVINQGTYTRGTKVNTIGLERYYQSRKQQAGISKELKEEQTFATTAAAIRKDKILLLNNALIESLTQITNRKAQELEQSLATLQDSDLKGLSDLCCNYSKLQHYSKS
jgi:hypothetical protein